jgi:cyclophilin family peptidyl-prolyl cis-trans isomerase
MNILKLLFLIPFLGATAMVQAKAPAAPTDFKVKVLGINTFQLDWKDKSNNEVGWEIAISIGETSRAERFTLISSPNITSYLVTTNDLIGTTLTFQLAAYNGKPGFERFSKRTPPVIVKTPSAKKFAAASGLTATPVNDNTVRLKWKDNSNSEHGFQIETKKGLDNWAPVQIVNPGLKFNELVTGLEPGTTYSFRIRAYRNNPVTFTPYSNVATGAPFAFLAPAAVTAEPKGEGDIELKWDDKSNIEGGYEIESKTGTAEFSKLYTAGPNSEVLNHTGLPINTTYSYRMRSFRTVNGVQLYSSYSPVTTATTSKLKTPTNLAASVLSDSSVKLTWTDNSSREYAYVAQYRKLGETAYTTASGTASSNATEFTVSGLVSNTDYEFRIGATDFATPSYSTKVAAKTKQGLIGNFSPFIKQNQPFLYQLQFSDVVNLTSVTVTGLPSGLTFDSVARVIKGKVTTTGTWTVTITSNYSDGSVSTRTLTLRILSGVPIASSGFSSVSVATSATKNVALTGKFTDPDTPDAVRVATTKGNIDIILYPDSTPKTVANFLAYVEDELYDDSFFHRAPQDFVVQGGGFRHTTAAGFERIPTFPAVVNEPGLSNTRGTVAMAKLGGDPNSATNQFFVNLGDNSGGLPALDTQNGGFTVFGRVSTPSLTVVDAINALPKNDYDITIGTDTNLFEDVPVNAESAPVSLDPAQLVKVTSVTYPPLLAYEVTSANTAIATAALNPAGTEVVVTGVAVGSTNITVKVTDLDGQTTSQTFSVTVTAP